jgi:adenylate cyclase
MSDVFISYARPDEAQATRVADGLRELGYRVWRDDELPAHRAYAEVIEERLKSAKAVVVLWSADAAKSQWVRAEADSARSAGTLIQATLDGTIPPMPFNQIQSADLARWDGAEAPGWRKLAASVAALAGEPAA